MNQFELSTDTYNPSDLRREGRRKPLQPDESERQPLEDIDSVHRPLVPDDLDFPTELHDGSSKNDMPEASSAGTTKIRRAVRRHARKEQPAVDTGRKPDSMNDTPTDPVAADTADHDESAGLTTPPFSIRNFFRDERPAIFLGVVLILFTAYLLVATISYIANEATDQSALLYSSADIIKGRAADIKNTTGWVGAFLSHFLIYRSLGLGAFFLIFYLGTLGLHLVRLCRIRFWSFTFKCLISAIAVSLIAGLLTINSASPTFWGGEHGYYINRLLIDNASLWSAIAVGIAMLTALILIFINPLALVYRKICLGIRHIRNHWAKRHNDAIEAAHRTEVRRQAERAAAMARAAEMEARKATEEADAHKFTDHVDENPDEVINMTGRTGAKTGTEAETPAPVAADSRQSETQSMPAARIKPAPLDELLAPLGPSESSDISMPAKSTDTASTLSKSNVPKPSPLSLETTSDPVTISLDDETIGTATDLTDPSGPSDEADTGTTGQELPPMTVTLTTPDDNHVNDTDSDPAIINLDDSANAKEKISDNASEKVQDNYDPHADLSHYRFPTLDLLREITDDGPTVDEEEQEANKLRITNILRSYGVEIASISATIGPTITLYEIVPAPGVRISKIKRLGDDVALSLAAMGIRIIAPMPGKGTIGMEVPNKKARIVSMRSILSSRAYRESKAQLPMALGNTISNEVYVTDLAKMPHLLVAGATGMGKSVGLNTIIASLLYRKHPSELKFVLVDPKMVEFSLYRCIERHYLAKLPGEDSAIITQPENVVATLNSLCKEMDDRYQLLSDAGVRGIVEYNEKFVQRRLNPEKGHRFLPYIVVVIDEFADLILTVGKEVETPISRLAAKARAIGIHVILATQRPSVNVITGVIKANFPSRMAFRVTQRNDSQTIIDRPGAEQLIGRGDMLISRNGIIDRVQCAFIDTPEVEAICNHIAAQQSYPSAYELPEITSSSEASANAGSLADRDPLFADAGREVIAQGIGSTSSLQRKFNIGYPRAGKIMDQLEMAGVVGPTQGGKPRAVLVDMYSFERFLES